MTHDEEYQYYVAQRAVFGRSRYRMIVRGLAIIAVFAIAALVIAVVLMAQAHARDLNGRYANSPDHQWFIQQRSPKTGGYCCDESDGTYAEEDMRDKHYWTKFVANGVSVDWMQVPDDVVIHNPNRHGAPVVWFYFQDGTAQIRCYAPGGGV